MMTATSPTHEHGVTSDAVAPGGQSRPIYLVTGGTGFLGSHVVRQLLDRGDAVRMLVRPSSPAIGPGRPAPRHIPDGAEIADGDVSDRASLDRFLTVPDGVRSVVIHCAGIVTMDPEYDPLVMDINVGGTRNIVDACLAHPECDKLVYVGSTGAIPEVSRPHRIKEVHEYEPERVVGCYSRSKAYATLVVLEAVRNRGLNACVVHPSGIFGPGDYAVSETTGTVIQLLHGEMPCGIQGSFNLGDVRDLARGCILAADKGRSGESYILANEEVTLREFAELLVANTGCKPLRVFLPQGLANAIAGMLELRAKRSGTKPLMTRFSVYNLARNNAFNYDKAQEELGYSVRPYADTIKDEVSWLVAERMASLPAGSTRAID